MEEAKSEAREHGFITTIMGRKCHIKARAFAERQAINAPIQGAAADIMRRAMIKMPEAIKEVEGARLLLQVHDELVFEVPEDRAEELINIAVPTLLVEANAAKNWNDAH